MEYDGGRANKLEKCLRMSGVVISWCLAQCLTHTCGYQLVIVLYIINIVIGRVVIAPLY